MALVKSVGHEKKKKRQKEGTGHGDVRVCVCVCVCVYVCVCVVCVKSVGEIRLWEVIRIRGIRSRYHIS